MNLRKKLYSPKNINLSIVFISQFSSNIPNENDVSKWSGEDCKCLLHIFFGGGDDFKFSINCENGIQ